MLRPIRDAMVIRIRFLLTKRYSQKQWLLKTSQQFNFVSGMNDFVKTSNYLHEINSYLIPKVFLFRPGYKLL